MHLYGGRFGGFHFIWWIVGIIFMAYLFFRLVNLNSFGYEDNSTHHILKDRFAKGEISKEEFENSKRILNI
jgi:putative membrane protein